MNRFLSMNLTLLCLMASSSCSTTPIDENDPAALLKEAEGDIESDHYLIAIDKLRVIKNKFPYSKHAIDAQLRIADVFFLQESYAEAAGSYESFRDLHPKHEKAGYALFRAGKSYYHDIPSTISRDLTPAKKALETYRDFLNRYSHAPETIEAQKDSAEIRGLLADKELQIAEFYFKRDFYHSAKPRYKKVIELYPETTAAEIAMKKLAKEPLQNE